MRLIRNLIAGLIAAAFCVVVSISSAAEPVDFQRQVRSILKRHCDRCHGGTNQEASLTLATSEGLLGTADSDEAIVVPGSADQSLLIKRITDESLGDLMPLDGDRLTDDEIALLKQWIQQGAKIPESGPAGHWAYETPVVDPQAIQEAQRQGISPIDYFVSRRIDEAGLSSEGSASPETLARRVSLALTGLPATLRQIDSLQADPSDENYERLVDELLSSSAFGVHWARHWLDLARYADSNGFQADQLRDSWAYRDWVVDALNADMPFDQFVIEQLAGDLLPDATTRTKIATGFHRTPTCNVEAGVHPEANRVQQVFDRVNTTATVFLGTTLECAQCHDHKYDPFTQKDYYRLFAYFNNTPLEVENTSGVTYDFVGPKMDLPMSHDHEERREQLSGQLARLTKQRDELKQGDRFASWRADMRDKLRDRPAKWIVATPAFSTTGLEEFEILDDNSVLLTGSLPGSTVYRFEYSGLEGPISGIRVDALRHDSLPGKGPGRGDAERTNFVVHEIGLSVHRDGEQTKLSLGDAKASFSQSKYAVAQAVDGDRKTGWAIAPKFQQEHWATFLTTESVEIDAADKVVVSIDQHFGRGRVIGRAKVSLLIGDPDTADLSDQFVAWLTSDKELKPAQLRKLRDYFSKNDPEIRALERKIQTVNNQLKQIQPDTTLVMVEQNEPRETFVMLRGDYQATGDKVTAGTPQSLHALDPAFPDSRLGLAKWIVDPANPLTSRVTVNRFWSEVFGSGIVTTPEDFGTQSETPSHPELLDWLAVELQQNGWSVKSLLKTIVLSRAFRRSSTVSPSAAAKDPENRLLARGPRYRLAAETIRDNALAVSGLLSQQTGGVPIMPFQPEGIWRAVGRNQPKWNAAKDDDRYRRGLYVVWKRSAPYPSFVTFDAPDRAACTVKRPRTNTPLQALVTMNDLAYAEASVGLAQRMMLDCDGETPNDIAAYGYRLTTGKAPSESTVAALVGLYQSQFADLKNDPDEVVRRVDVLLKTFRRPLPKNDKNAETKLAAWYAVANALLNLDQTMTLN